MGSILWWLDARDDAQRYGTLVRDVDWAQQSMRLRMLAARDRIGALGRDLVRTNMNEGRFLDDARELLTEHPEIIHVAWLDADRRAQWISTPERRASQSFRMSTPGVSDPGAVMAFEIARNEHRPTYSRPYQGQYNEVYVDLYLPVFQNERFLGNLAAVYSVDSMLQQFDSPGNGPQIQSVDIGWRGPHAGVLVVARRQGGCQRLRSPPRSARQRDGAARARLPHHDRNVADHAGVGGGVAVSRHHLEPAGPLAPHPLPVPGRRSPDRRNGIPAGHGKRHPDRHARDRHGRTDHLREPGLLPHDGLERIRPDRPCAALPLLAPGRPRSAAARPSTCF